MGTVAEMGPYICTHWGYTDTVWRRKGRMITGIHRLALLMSVFTLGIALTSCAVAPSELSPGKSDAAESPGTTGETQAAQSADCPVTLPTVATPPDSDHRDPLPHGAYFTSADRLIWAEVVPWRIGNQKVRWIKPDDSRLLVQGRRLDGDAAPLWAAIGDGYVGDFQASWLTFPTSGCWEVEARANESFLQFVLYVPPRSELTETPRVWGGGGGGGGEAGQ
ncbi:MAG: hypothetical protein F4X83_03820 [Chloroflexi bacterium]|nr:hypothetical protein [Chloroflexota bacterium]